MPKKKRKPLPTAARNALRSASRVQMEETARRRLKRNCENARWLCASNRYQRRASKRIELDVRNGTINEAHLREYLAGSAPAHLIDGWSYLGRAADALMRGDAGTAVHMAYYSELRAASSLLAAHGIGIFSKHHMSVAFNGSVLPIPCQWPTHRFIWPAISHWSEPAKAQAAMFSSLKAGGIDLWQWITAFQGGTSANALGARWLSIWGMDLRRMNRDHYARNEVSYRPSSFRTASSLSASATMQFVASLWRLFEPGPAGHFESVDRWLLRRAIERAFQGIRNTSSASSPNVFRQDVERMLGSLSLSATEHDQWLRFLLRMDSPIDPSPFVLAESRTSKDDGELAVQVMSRGALLLRLATGSTSAMLRGANIGAPDLEFWWKEFGVQRGLWKAGSSPVQVADAWADIEMSIVEVEGWQLKTPPVGFREVRESVAALELGAFDVISTWGLAP